MKKVLLIISILIVIVISSCKDEITQPYDSSKKNLLRKFYSSSNINSYNQFYYNDFNKIIKIESYGSTGLERKSEYHYDDKGNLIKENVYHTYFGGPEYYYLIYEYNNKGFLERTLAYLNVGEEVYEFRSITTYEYDSNNRVVLENLYNTDSIRTQYYEFFYDSIGNVIEKKHYFGEKIIFDDKYEYDNKKNPLNLTRVHFNAQNLGPNNIITHSQINYNLNDADYTHTYLYEYNSSEYPANCTCISESSELFKVVFEYY